MIVRPGPDHLLLITQPDHAHFAAELLSLFRVDELIAHPRRDRLLQAIRLHDNGWQETDSAPRVNPANDHPFGFQDLPSDLRLELWRRGSRRYLGEEPFVALLIVEHARALLGGSRDLEGYPAFLAELDDLAGRLLERCALTSAELTADYRWLEAADRLSLAVCGGWEEPFTRLDYTARVAADTLILRPFPLAGRTVVPLRARRIPRRLYESDRDLAVTLAGARWEEIPIRVARHAGRDGPRAES